MAKVNYFDEPCFGTYDNSLKRPKFELSDEGEIYNSAICEKQYIASPLYQQLHDWFDKWGIVISIEYAAPDTNKFHYRIDNYHPIYRIAGTDIMAGSYGNYSEEWYKTRKACTDAAFTEAFKILNKK